MLSAGLLFLPNHNLRHLHALGIYGVAKSLNGADPGELDDFALVDVGRWVLADLAAERIALKPREVHCVWNYTRQ